LLVSLDFFISDQQERGLLKDRIQIPKDNASAIEWLPELWQEKQSMRILEYLVVHGTLA
jgi:hypothetical protein